MRERIRISMIVSVVVMALFTTCAHGQAVSEGYGVTLDANGQLSSSVGTWYEYPGGPYQRYFLWIKSTGFDPNRMGAIEIGAGIRSLSSQLPANYRVHFGWTRSTWTDAANPPLPPLTGDESDYFTESLVTDLLTGIWYIDENNWTHENQTNLVEEFNPLWVYVSISGRNVNIEGTLSVESVTELPPTIGACCKQSTGECYYTDTGSCTLGYIYLGDDSSCTDCQVTSFAQDFGDAPASYPVLLSQDGARHTMTDGMFLGVSINGEPEGQPSPNAIADSWDDGFVIQTQILAGQSTSVTVTASRFGVINAWLDLNADGDWQDIGEHIIVDEPVIQGQNAMSFYVPITATPGTSFTRVRYNSSGGLSFTGSASDGEVEDYLVTIVSGTDPGPGPDPDPGIDPISPMNQLASKWFQPVDLLASTNNFVYGWNIVTRRDSIPLIADDWRNGSVLPVQGIRWWGAFDNWLLAEMPSDLPLGFHIGIWSHNPSFEKPGTLIWEHTSTNWTWAYTGQVRDAQGQLGGESVFEFSALMSQDKWFYPNAAPDTIYWLSIAPIYSSNVISPTPWGWMTRQSNGTLAAERILTLLPSNQWPPTLGSLYGAGSPVTYPATTNWDVAFELITSQPGGGTSGGNSSLEDAIGDLNDDGVVDINDLYILLGFVLNP